MDLIIRAVREQDQEAIHQILMSPHVIGGSMRVPFAPLQQTQERLTPDISGLIVLEGNDHALRLYESLGFGVREIPRTQSS